MQTATEIIDEIIRREGGFVDHPADRGGPTKYGITQSTLAGYRGKAVSRADVRALTEDEAREIYRQQYVEPFAFLPTGIHPLNTRLMGLLVDSAVQHGPRRVTCWLQEIIGVPVDGILGPVTRHAVLESMADHPGKSEDIYFRLLAMRLRFYGRLITNDRSQSVFAAGWMNRVSEFLEVYHELG